MIFYLQQEEGCNHSRLHHNIIEVRSFPPTMRILRSTTSLKIRYQPGLNSSHQSCWCVDTDAPSAYMPKLIKKTLLAISKTWVQNCANQLGGLGIQQKFHWLCAGWHSCCQDWFEIHLVHSDLGASCIDEPWKLQYSQIHSSSWSQLSVWYQNMPGVDCSHSRSLKCLLPLAGKTSMIRQVCSWWQIAINNSNQYMTQIESWMISSWLHHHHHSILLVANKLYQNNMKTSSVLATHGDDHGGNPVSSKAVINLTCRSYPF